MAQEGLSALAGYAIGTAQILILDWRPDWAGGESIPWTSVTRVSAGRSPEQLHVTARDRKINLNLMLFANPAAGAAPIRRHVPADRLEI